MFKLIVFVLGFILLVAGCGGLVTGFRELSSGKHTEAIELYGNGKYYRHMARGSDLRKIGDDRLLAMKVLVEKSMESSKVCRGEYEIMDESLVFFEGGSASIIVRCSG